MQKIKTHFLDYRAGYKPMWKNTVQAERPQIKIQYGAVALHTGQLRLQTHTRLHNTVLIAFPRQRWLRERASVTLHVEYFFVTCMCHLTNLSHVTFCGIVQYIKNVIYSKLDETAMTYVKLKVTEETP